MESFGCDFHLQAVGRCDVRELLEGELDPETTYFSGFSGAERVLSIKIIVFQTISEY